MTFGFVAEVRVLLEQVVLLQQQLRRRDRVARVGEVPVPEELHPLDERGRSADHLVDAREDEVGVLVGRVKRLAVVGAGAAGQRRRRVEQRVDRGGDRLAGPRRAVGLAGPETGPPEQAVDVGGAHRLKIDGCPSGGGVVAGRHVQPVLTRLGVGDRGALGLGLQQLALRLGLGGNSLIG